MRTKPTNKNLIRLIDELKTLSRKQEVSIWKRVANDLSKPSRNRREVNISKINRYTKENETIVVPGKILSMGELDHKVNVAAWTFSDSAKKKIDAKGKAMTITELTEQNPKGSKVRIIG